MAHVNLEERRAYHRRWAAANKDKRRTNHQRWVENNREKVRESGRRYAAANPETLQRWRDANPEKVREIGARYKKKHPEKQKQYERKNRGQIEAPPYPCPSVCELCGKPPGNRALAEDHDKVTGKFRGWLHGKCNLAIGALGDTEAGIDLAKIYFTSRRAPALVLS